ncbi:hypothetical protein [Kutzneria sp. NPDC052558]|uniref:hypothetical protein n=1 Tax=Kutzneria sp. NPDC052558 TaxID=3364121 RepID=UPI0037CB6E9A
MKLPPYQQMPPEVRMRLRQRVLPGVRPAPRRRAPYLAAAALVVAASFGAALLLSPAHNPAPPAASPTTTDSDLAAYQRLVDQCHADPGTWSTGAYLVRANGDSVQLATKPLEDTLGICLISNGHSTHWSAVTTQRLTQDTPYQAIHDNGLVYGTLSVAGGTVVTANGIPAVVSQGTFIAEVPTPGPVTLVFRDAQGDILDQGTVN